VRIAGQRFETETKLQVLVLLSVMFIRISCEQNFGLKKEKVTGE